MEQYKQERERLLSALGQITAGGIVEGIEHIGATSVPGPVAAPCVDIGMAVWPFPLEATRGAALAALDYEAVSVETSAFEQRFRHRSGMFQLFIVGAGSERWTEYLLIRDYLRGDEQVREEWQGETGAPKALHFERMLPAAREWWVSHHGYRPVEAVRRELSALDCARYIASGWALDLFLGQVSRVHHDVDIAIRRSDQLRVQRYLSERGWQWVTPFEGRLEPWPPQMPLALGGHQAHAHRDGAFMDFLLTDIEHSVWRYRRAPAIVRSVERMCLTSKDGIPYLAPELVLLFKSKNTSDQQRSKDQIDFERVHRHLESERRAWLCWALTATAPEHPWIGLLSNEA